MSNRSALLFATLQVVAGLYLGNIRGEYGKPAWQRVLFIWRWLQNGFVHPRRGQTDGVGHPYTTGFGPMGWEAVGWSWGWDICKCLLELLLLADSEDRDSLRRHGVTHILSVHNGAKPVLEVSEGHRGDAALAPSAGGGAAGGRTEPPGRVCS